jgi:TPR repeat protein
VGQATKQARLDAGTFYTEGLEWYFGSNVRVKDERRGQLLIEAAAEQGDACAEADCIYRGWGGRFEDDEEAFKRFLELSEKEGHVEAMIMTGYCYYNGTGMAMDMKKAVEWYTKAAEQGNSDAQNTLGVCYDNGEGVAMDKEKAVDWFTKAAEQGNSSAQYFLGYCYEYGEGVTMDKEMAVEWYTQAAEQGDSEAQSNLGRLLLHLYLYSF